MALETYTFINFGGALQLQLERAEQLGAVATLDDPFWMATSAPTHQLRLENSLLKQLDPHGSGRILSEDIRRTVSWVLNILQDYESIDNRLHSLALSAFDENHKEGKRLREVAEHVLKNVGAVDTNHISLAQVLDRKRIFAEGARNGDGVIPPEAAKNDAPLRTFIDAALQATGGIQDRNGAMGISGALLTQFLDEASKALAWHAESDGQKARYFPLGSKTKRAFAELETLKADINAYFDLCRLVEMGILNPQELVPKGLFSVDNPAALLRGDGLETFLASAPIAAPQNTPVLDIESPLNPFKRKALLDLFHTVCLPILGDDFDGKHLNEGQWNRVQSAFEAYAKWQNHRPETDTAQLDPDLLKFCLESDAKTRLQGLIQSDEAAKDEMDDIEDLECLLQLQPTLLDICNNFISFPDLYDPSCRAAFETGCLVMDGRLLNFTLRVRDVNAHAKAAARSGIFLLYCQITGDSGVSFQTVTPVTAGRIRELRLGKRGVLFDLNGKQYDAQVIKVVDNPVSLTEALLGPIRKFADKLAGFFKKLVSDAEKQVDAALDKNLGTLQKDFSTGIKAATTAEPGSTLITPPSPPTAPPTLPRGQGQGFRDILLSASVAVAALGSSFAFMTQTFASLKGETIIIALATIPILILLPTIFVTAIRLRKRNLSAILEASGWALNAPMYLTWNLGRVLTITPDRPTHIKVLNRDRLKSLRQKTRGEFLPGETQKSHQLANRGDSRK